MASSNVAADTSKDASRSDVEKAIGTVRENIGKFLDANRTLCPLLLKIAFYDAISYDPIAKANGPNGWIRFCAELNAEEKRAIQQLDDNMLKGSTGSTVAPYVSYADLYQLAGIEVVKKAIGPIVEFQHGRSDSYIPSKIPMISEDPDAATVRNTFHRIGFNDKEIVALSSAYYYWMNPPAPSSSSAHPPSLLNNSYYTLLRDVKASPTTFKPSSKYWKCLINDNSFYKHVELFAKDEDGDAFFKAYAVAHKKLSELGFKQFPEPIPIEADYHDMRHGIAFAMAMTILVGFMGFIYEAMRIN